ncbi:Protein of unknown function [Gryllus bimaculatus]|nr:Protein of unknown function [Gryllus bimaculatus]
MVAHAGSIVGNLRDSLGSRQGSLLEGAGRRPSNVILGQSSGLRDEWMVQQPVVSKNRYRCIYEHTIVRTNSSMSTFLRPRPTVVLGGALGKGISISSVTKTVKDGELLFVDDDSASDSESEDVED